MDEDTWKEWMLALTLSWPTCNSPAGRAKVTVCSRPRVSAHLLHKSQCPTSTACPFRGEKSEVVWGHQHPECHRAGETLTEGHKRRVDVKARGQAGLARTGAEARPAGLVPSLRGQQFPTFSSHGTQTGDELCGTPKNVFLANLMKTRYNFDSFTPDYCVGCCHFYLTI